MGRGTPLFEPVRYNRAESPDAKILLKLEYLNPAGSVKDRVALSMILDAEARGLLVPGATIIEPTSGNTGIGLAAIGVPRGYRVILTMPDTMSVERRALLAAYGAEIVLTPGALGMKGAIEKAEELAREIEGSFIPAQFDNPANPAAHRATTGPEILEDTAGVVDIFVAGIGTGGTFTGTASYLKKHLPLLKAVAVEPASSPLISMGRAGAHGLQGIGANFIPANFDRSLADDVISVTEEEA
ncbi:MAG: pyridoxal-phosphate dependent enzyme, partial [Clostridia bacterium]|nr:pyridoxal-phosphate dependent enzyme [Clostridia bacterium]